MLSDVQTRRAGGWYRRKVPRIESSGYTHGDANRTPGPSGLSVLTRLLSRLLSPRQYARSSAYNRRLLRDLGGVVVDVGCGGFHRKFPLPADAHYYGLDLSPRATHVQGDGHQLPFAGGSADWVLLVAVLEHVDDPAGVLAETMRVLKPEGKVYVAVPFLQMEHAAADYWRWTGQGLPRLLAEAGLAISEGGANGGALVAVDYLLWHTLRQARARRRWDIALPAALLKLLAQPLALLDQDVAHPAFATSFHYLAVRADGQQRSR
ncbi:MAG: class I SAM-dependent methyltransferase [Chloroflexota bacterium]